jgi:hypothetical protein
MNHFLGLTPHLQMGNQARIEHKSGAILELGRSTSSVTREIL